MRKCFPGDHGRKAGIQGKEPDYIEKDIKVNLKNHTWFSVDEMWDRLALQRPISPRCVGDLFLH